MNKQNSDDSTYIECDDLPLGIISCFDNAKEFYNSGKLLYENKNYRASIISTMISIEETSKAAILLHDFIYDRRITKSHWNDLNNHNYKFTRIYSYNRPDVLNKAVEQFSDKKELEQYMKQYDEISSNLSKLSSSFKPLKEHISYVDWKRMWTQSYNWEQNLQKFLSLYFIYLDELFILHFNKGIASYHFAYMLHKKQINISQQIDISDSNLLSKYSTLYKSFNWIHKNKILLEHDPLCDIDLMTMIYHDPQNFSIKPNCYKIVEKGEQLMADLPNYSNFDHFARAHKSIPDDIFP